MATGKIKSLYPPGNNGNRPGAGKLTDDATGTDYVFQTPGDVTDGLVLSVGMAIAFDISNGKNISNVRVAAPTCSLNASSTSINSGDSVTLTWTSQNADNVTLVQDVRNTLSTSSSGSLVITPPVNTTIVLTAANSSSGQQATSSVSINVTTVTGSR